MNAQTAITTEQANSELLTAAQAILKAVVDMTKDPSVDFSLPVFARVAKAHVDLTDAVTQSVAMAAIAKSKR
jgi:hypothetical protein